MKIETVKLGLPSRLVTNDDILDFIEHESDIQDEKELKHILKKTEVLLRASGSKERFWRSENETPFNFNLSYSTAFGATEN
jgi:hypothetical protein